MRTFGALLVLVALSAGAVSAQEQSGTASSPTRDSLVGRTLVIGTKEAAPFAMRSADSTWTGMSIDLWTLIAREIGTRTVWRDVEPLHALLDSVAAARLDAAVAAVTVTAEREIALDFSQPFYVSGLAIAVPAGASSAWSRVFHRFFSWDFLSVVALLLGLLVAVGAAVWIFERRTNPDQFGGSPARGVGAGVWWSAVTMTTVGYGDKAPLTLGGRIVGLLWMFAALVMVSTFTAAMTSALTVGELEGKVHGPADLAGARVGTVSGSTSEEYLSARHIQGVRFQSVEDALGAAGRGELDAVVYDAPILQYAINTGFRGRVRVLPGTFETQFYGIALPEASPLAEPVNRALLAIVAGPEWQEIRARYLGE